MDSLIDKLRAAIEAGDRGPICADDGTWETSPSQPFAVAHRKILELHPHKRFKNPLSADSPFDEDHRAAFAEDPRYVGCERCSWDFRYEEVYPSWWCDHVLALVEAYDLTVEEPVS